MDEWLMLAHGLPEEVEISGKSVKVDTNFRLWILLDALLFDREIREEEREGLALDLIFDEVPTTREERDAAFMAAMTFYNMGKACGGETSRKAGKAEKKGIAERAFDFVEDWAYIYAAFLQVYQIDLLSPATRLHWWQFRALFSALPEECMMSRIIGYRTMDLSKIKDKDQKAMYKRLKEAYRLGSGMTREEKIANAGALFAPRG